MQSRKDVILGGFGCLVVSLVTFWAIYEYYDPTKTDLITLIFPVIIFSVGVLMIYKGLTEYPDKQGKTKTTIFFRILKKSLVKEKNIYHFYLPYLLMICIGLYKYFMDDIVFFSVFKLALFMIWLPLAPVILDFIDENKKYKLQQNEYNKRITYAQQPTTAPSYQTPPTPSAEEHRPPTPQPEPNRNRAETIQERPTQAREQGKAYQEPPQREKANQRQTKEDIINEDVLNAFKSESDKGNKEKTTHKSTVETVINDFEASYEYMTDPKTGKKLRTVKDEHGNTKIIDTDSEGVPNWFKDMFNEAIKKQSNQDARFEASSDDERKKEIFLKYFDFINFSSDFDISTCDISKIMKFKNLKAMLNIISKDEEMKPEKKQARTNEIYTQNFDIINELYPFFIHRNTGILLIDYVLNTDSTGTPRERPTEAREQGEGYQEPPQREKATGSPTESKTEGRASAGAKTTSDQQRQNRKTPPKWGTGGETGREKPKRGRPKKQG